MNRPAIVFLMFACTAWAHDEHRDPEYAWGRPGEKAAAARTVRVEMDDTLRYSPARISVRRGETIRFVVHNRGKLPHEMVIGNERELREHAVAMRAHPGMQHDEPYMAQVPPGEARELAWTFTNPGTFTFGCLVPGHWEGGMRGVIVVGPKRE